MDFLIEKFGDRYICIKGVGKMFYENGLPISISISELKKKNIEVSIFHIADECLKNGWSAKTTYNKIKSDLEDDIENNTYDYDILKKFCFSEYEDQREIIFKYLFGIPTDDVRKNISQEPIKWLSDKFKN